MCGCCVEVCGSIPIIIVVKLVVLCVCVAILSTWMGYSSDIIGVTVLLGCDVKDVTIISCMGVVILSVLGFSVSKIDIVSVALQIENVMSGVQIFPIVGVGKFPMQSCKCSLINETQRDRLSACSPCNITGILMLISIKC